MDLHITLASAPPSAFPAREIVVDTTMIRTGAALARRFRAAGYPDPFTVDGIPLTALVPGSAGLTDGAVVLSGVHPGRGGPVRIPHLVFVVHSGPDAGQVFPLTRGSYTIGRAAGDIVVSDPALSRNHARLTVAEDSILLEDLDSANGTFVDGERITAALVTVSMRLRLGTSGCRIEFFDDRGWEAVSAPGLLQPVPVGADPPHQPSRILVLTALLPLVLGVVLALTTGTWFFLAFSALSSVTGLVPLLTYRGNARTFAGAVRYAAERDRARRERAVPDPGQTALDALRASGPWARPRNGPSGSAPSGSAPPAPEVVLLRLGTADQPAHLSVGRNDASFTPPTLPGLPLVLPCPTGGDGTGLRRFTIVGDLEPVRALARAVLLQVAHPEAGAPPVVCWGSVTDVPHHARFLPNVQLTRDPGTLAALVGPAGVRLVFQFSEDLPDLPRTPGVFVVRFLAGRSSSTGMTGSGATASGAGMTVSAAAARALIGSEEYEVLPDGVSARTFERTARALARAAAGSAESTVSAHPDRAASTVPTPPRSASVWNEQIGPDDLARTVLPRWSSADAERPTAYLGASATGPVSIDLARDGPHLLVAGTTGSGKSEFLRTFVLGLAMDQPPEHLTLLLIDYKGGSGLAALASLPHCVGCLTDLSPESTGRALISLRAELRRREHLCAEHRADDLAGLRRAFPSSCPPRLVIVIDEFRMLSDEVPTAVPDLMKIAALGRSLGVHVVLATQRAQGAVTPDIRANITSSVLLRVQTAAESQDLLGSAAASAIPIDIPGRAFLRRGTEPPVVFQVASCSELPATAGSPGWQDLAAHLGGTVRDVRNGTPPGAVAPGPPQAAPPASPGRPPPLVPVPASPPGTTGSARDDGSRDGDGPDRIGDRGPGRDAGRGVLQRAIENLSAAACPQSGGRSGGRPNPRSGPPSDQHPHRPVLPPLPARLSPTVWHGFLPADPRPAGATARGPSGPAAVALGVADFPDRQEQRLLQWRPEEHSHLALVGLPGSGGTEALGSAVASLLTADPDLHLYLLDGDGTLAGSALRPQVGAHVLPHETKRAGRVLERLSDLPLGGSAEAPRVVLAITGWGGWSSRFRTGRSARAEEDLHSVVRDGAQTGVTVLISGDRELTASRFFALLPNRVYLPLGAHPETALTWPKMPPIGAVAGRGFIQGRITGTWGDGTCQLVLEPGTAGPPYRPPARPPFPVHPLPSSIPFDGLVPLPDGTRGRRDLLLGVQGDDLRPCTIPVRPGEVYPVLGHAASGRTNALRVLARSAALLLPRGAVIALPDGTGRGDAAVFWRRIAERRADLPPPERTLLMVDDADHLPGDVQQALSGLVAQGAAAVLSAVPGNALMTRVPLSLQARGSGRGFVLSPRSPGDGDFLGVRLDVDGTAIPGRGYACDPSGVIEVQVALAPGSADGTLPGPAAAAVPTAFARPRSFER